MLLICIKEGQMSLNVRLKGFQTRTHSWAIVGVVVRGGGGFHKIGPSETESTVLGSCGFRSASRYLSLARRSLEHALVDTMD